jgi:hypothetical protein
MRETVVPYFECDDLSSLFSVRPVADGCKRVITNVMRRRAAAGDSGDRSPHSK